MKLKDYAFQNSNMTEYIMPNDVTEMGEGVFWNSAVERVVWSPSMTEVPTDTFFQCRALTSMELPEGVTKIGMNAFWQCTSLCEIMLPSTVNVIDDDAFGGCENLERVTIKNPNIQIGYGAFDGTKIGLIVEV